MGPLEQELRSCAAATPAVAAKNLSDEAWRLAMGARFELESRLGWVTIQQHWPEIMSEAIEAAEALKQ